MQVIKYFEIYIKPYQKHWLIKILAKWLVIKIFKQKINYILAIKTISKSIMSFKLSGSFLLTHYLFYKYPPSKAIFLWIYWLLVTQMNNCS